VTDQTTVDVGEDTGPPPAHGRAVPAAPSSPSAAVHGLIGRDTPLRPVADGLRMPVLDSLDRVVGRAAPASAASPLPADLDRLMEPPGLRAKELAAAWDWLTGRLRFIERPAGEPVPLLAVHAAHAARSRRPIRSPRPGVYMPPANWALVASLAWDGLAFRRTVAERILGCLRETHLIPPGTDTVPRLAAETCWLLLAAAAHGRCRWWMWGDRRKRALRAETVRHLASLMALGASGWAGFWDQWVLVRLLDGDPGLTSRLWPELGGMLRSLPVAGGAADAAENPLIRPGWLGEKPDWLPVSPLSTTL